jgi:competence protein ComFC
MNVLAAAKAVREAGLGWFYPPACQICETTRATAAEGYVCAVCRDQIRIIEPPFCHRCGLPSSGEITTVFECGNCLDMAFEFSAARSAVITGPVILPIIHRYKYNRALWFEPLLADLLVQRAAPVLRDGNWQVIVPVPLFPTKEREREFNQAEHLALHLSRATGIPLNKKLLRRVQPTLTQTRLTRQKRAENVRRAFSWTGGQPLRGERIVLVDDVFTTGATTNACATVLRAHGAGEVCVWTVARGL